MTRDCNRGRDLPRGPEFQRKGWPREGITGDPVEDGKRKERARKALNKLHDKHGYYKLDIGAGTTVGNDEKTIAKERKVVISAHVFGLNVHPSLERRVGLYEDPSKPFVMTKVIEDEQNSSNDPF